VMTFGELGWKKSPSPPHPCRLSLPLPFFIPLSGPTAHADAVPEAVTLLAGRVSNTWYSPKSHLTQAAAPAPGNGCRPIPSAYGRPRVGAAGPNAPASVRPSLPLPTRPQSEHAASPRTRDPVVSPSLPPPPLASAAVASVLGQTRSGRTHAAVSAPRPAPFTTPLRLQTVTLATNLSAASRAPAGPGRGARSLAPPPPGPAPSARLRPRRPARAPIGPRPRPAPTPVLPPRSPQDQSTSWGKTAGAGRVLGHVTGRCILLPPPAAHPRDFFQAQRWTHRSGGPGETHTWDKTGARSVHHSGPFIRSPGTPPSRGMGMAGIPSAGTRKKLLRAGWYRTALGFG
jgi:hypothetical protein